MNQTFYEDITREDLRDIIKRYSAKNVLLVTGRSSFELSGASGLIPKEMEGVRFHRFFDFEVNPKIEDAERGSKLFAEHNCDLILAVGGGSAIDIAKSINVFQAHSPTDFKELVVNNAITQAGVPLVAIPTTAGTGSEATHFAVIYVDSRKYSLADATVLPSVAGLNYRVSSTQPPYVTACTGLDALSQAIESFWSVNATEESQTYATQAIELLMAHLKDGVIKNLEASRQSLSRGAYLAGKAINISKTTAAHAVSYAFTTFYNIPHGHAVFLTLPQFLKYNAEVSAEDINDPRGVDYVKSNLQRLCQLLGGQTPVEAAQRLTDLAAGIQVELSLNKLGISDCQEVIRSNVNLERMRNNPRKVPSEAIIGILDPE